MDWDADAGTGYWIPSACSSYRPAFGARRNLLLYVQKENEAIEKLWGGERGWLGVDMKKEFLVCFYEKASVNVSRLPAQRSGPPHLTDSSGFHHEEKNV